MLFRSLMNIPDAALGAIVAASIAAVISLLSLIIAKEHKTSEFRQAWIDSLRTEIAMFIAHLNAIHGSLSTPTVSAEELWVRAKDDYLGANRTAASIRLRLNSKEEYVKKYF